MLQYSDYTTGTIVQVAPNSTAVTTGEEPVVAESKAASPPPDAKILKQEKKVVYRDQDGNILNDEQVKALEGKVEFQTKYETKTRVVDTDGNEIPAPDGGWDGKLNGAGVAPPHPDVEGVDKETVKVDGGAAPKDAAASRDGEREAEHAKAKPASDDKKATAKDEL